VASVIGIEKRQDKTWLFLDVGLFQAFVGASRFRPFPYPPYKITKQLKQKVVDYKNYVLTGPSCDSMDVITEEAWLPANLKIGDRLAFPNAGAYTVVYGANFNGFSVPPRFFINGDKE
jgi:ornithine decarboxylase